VINYNVSAFIQFTRAGLVENSTQEAAFRLLIASITTEEYVDISSSMITHLMKQNREIPDPIKKASAKREVTANAIHYFEDVVLPDLNPHLMEETCYKIVTLLTNDPTVPEKTCQSLISFYQNEQVGEFLARSFLYAVGRPNKGVGATPELEDVPFILEVGNKCPLCEEELVNQGRKMTLQGYQLTDIQLDTKLTSYQNKLALCSSCSTKYSYDTEFAESVELSKLKDQYINQAKLQQRMASASLEDDIKEVIVALRSIPWDRELEDFSLNILTIDKKILPENGLLLSQVNHDVLTYYRFIEKSFSNIDNFNVIASEINTAFHKIARIYSTQDEIVHFLCDWVLEKTKLSKVYHQSCRIIVAFFIQNCEVFYEITE